MVLGVYAIVASALGLALTPAVLVWQWVAEWGARLSMLGHAFAIALGTAVAFFVFGFALLVVVPVYNLVLPTRVRPFKGGYYTLRAAPWLLHNALFYLVRYTFLPFVTLTPFGIWFLKAMGMKIGRHAFINTEYISDPQLIQVGDDAALGGSVRICAHFGGGGHLTVAPVTIGARATLGLAVTVMGDVEVGDGATVLPNSVLLPGSRVAAGETWGGVPARRITREEMERLQGRNSRSATPLTTALLAPELEARLAALREAGWALFDQFDHDVRDHHFHPFVAANYESVLEALVAQRAPGLTFLEWGSATGVITIMADLLGYRSVRHRTGRVPGGDRARACDEVRLQGDIRGRQFPAPRLCLETEGWRRPARHHRAGTVGLSRTGEVARRV